nr:S8 family peptidase [Fredinandcohnia onubensis]
MERKVFDFPVKMVQLRKEDTKPNRVNGGGPKFFCEVTTELRNSFSSQVDKIGDVFEARFKETPDTPSVARVNLRPEAIAKSHRPLSLFSQSTCPIIGVGNSDELFIEVNPERLSRLKEKILTNNAKSVSANISTLKSITPYTPEDVLNEHIKEHIFNEEEKFVKIKLFKFFNEKTNIDTEKEFENHLKKFNSYIVDKIFYSKNLIIYKVEVNDLTKLESITNFGAVKSLSYFPILTSSEPQSIVEKELEPVELYSPEDGVHYPYVGVVDSGTRDENKYLSPWVEYRENFVLPEEKNCEHGSFVSGIISYGDRLIGEKTEYDGVKIIDVTAIPNVDPRYGQVGSLKEDELVQILQEVVPKYSKIVKVWNLSLGSSRICEEQEFSDLAVSLDEIQDENDVIFVISAGNFEEQLRPWPITNPNVFNDRITSPADSLRAVTVGSVSHIDSDITKRFEPSPFSRRGPGPNYITKPELVDFGGNIASSPFNIIGVPSFGEYGNLRGDIGTSFSAPRVSALLSKIHHYLDYKISRNVAKALLIHSANDRRKNNRPNKTDRPYLGFGQPQGLEKILDCTSSSSTLIFEGTIMPSTYVEISDFPFPTVLKENDKWTGEIFVTLVYNPPLNSDYSFEYCRSNIEVSLGTDKPNGYSSEVPLERNGQLERELIENGMKWAPVKVYHRRISNQGINAHPWKLKLTLSGRSDEVLQPQDFALIVTISDPQGNKAVYNDIAQQLQQRFIYSDLQIATRVRPTIE